MLLTLLAFGIVVVAALFVWTLLTPRRRAPAVDETDDAPRARPRSNDEVRGAKARAGTERPAGEDAFERFLRAGRDDPS
jgi:hypothetical protein